MKSERPALIAKQFPGSQWLEAGGFGPAWILPHSQDWEAAAQFLRDHPDFNFNMLEDYTALDQGDNLVLVLHLTCSAQVDHLTVKTLLAKSQPEIASLNKIYGSADWYEREIFDMFGILFTNHPDLRRILLPEDWSGYPLRKDYADSRLLKRPGGS